MRIEKLLALIPDDILSELAIETKVDYNAKKLQGEVIFKLLLYCLLTTKECSLRTMASAYETAIFSALNARYAQGSTIRYNSISERLSAINAGYFQQLYQHCVNTYKDTIGKEDSDKLLRFDSTIVALSSKLLKVGYHLRGGDADHVRQLKFTIGLGQIPEVVHFYSDQSHNSENKALKDAIMDSAGSTDIRVFDRGITSRATYDRFTERGIRFVSRINTGAKHEQVSGNRLPAPVVSERLIIEEDTDMALFSTGKVKTRQPLRCIKAKVRSAGMGPEASGDKELWFVTNIGAHELDAAQIAEVYRQRWDIEVFFKFVKQHLNFSHLLNRSDNGIKVVLYITLIAAVLVMAYKKLTGQGGFKLAKQQLAQELETEMLKNLITLCGGNPDILQQILKTNSS